MRKFPGYVARFLTTNRVGACFVNECLLSVSICPGNLTTTSGYCSCVVIGSHDGDLTKAGMYGLSCKSKK